MPSLEKIWDEIRIPDDKAHHILLSKDHDKHRYQVKYLEGLKRVPTKKSCPLCNHA